MFIWCFKPFYKLYFFLVFQCFKGFLLRSLTFLKMYVYVKRTAFGGNHLAAYILQVKTGTFSSVAQSCPTLCDPMNHSTPGLPVHHQLLEFTQTHIHQVSDATQPSHPLLSPSPPAPNPSQHQGLFQ